MDTGKDYNQLALNVCDLIVEKGYTTQNACKELGISRMKFYSLIQTDTDIANNYARAKEIDAERFADEILEIADGSDNDYVNTEEGVKFQSEHVQRAKLRVDTRKWLLSKRLPKKYGDKVDVTTGGKPIESVGTSIIAFEDYIKQLRAESDDENDALNQ